MVVDPSIFKDYDIRAEVPNQLDVEGVRRIAQAVVAVFNPASVQVGRDIRVSSAEFHSTFIEELTEHGVDVVDLGLTSTDMIYFVSSHYSEDMAINISASHNPPQYNGMKIMRKGAIAVSGRSGIYDLRDFVLSNKTLQKSEKKGTVKKRDCMNEFINHLLTFIDVSKMKPFVVASDAGNAMAGHYMPPLEDKLPWKVTRLYYELDGTFPNHMPSPIELKNMQDVIEKTREIHADFGVAFDGDGDRAFLVDEKGRYVKGTIMTAIVAESLLHKYPGETILYNAVVGRIVPEVVTRDGGTPIRVRVGHTLIKEDMRKHNALFCGEHSGHYYFRENSFADSAIIAVLLVAELMSVKNKKLSELVDEYSKYSSLESEINFIVNDKEKVMKQIESVYRDKCDLIDWLDGISVWNKAWWFNIRPSNTEPLLRLNIECDSDELLGEKTRELVSEIISLGGAIKE